jgi:diguanylate cyclase (GGDEF)-like protein
VLFDLDGFKRYNDRLGHAAGDELLETLGARLNDAVDGRGEAFRLGGDELCVLLESEDAVRDCEAALREDGIGASHGSAWLPREADTPSTALSLVDSRMYTAKRAAKDVPFVLAMGSESPSPRSDPAPSPAR